MYADTHTSGRVHSPFFPLPRWPVCWSAQSLAAEAQQRQHHHPQWEPSTSACDTVLCCVHPSSVWACEHSSCGTLPASHEEGTVLQLQSQNVADLRDPLAHIFLRRLRSTAMDDVLEHLATDGEEQKLTSPNSWRRPRGEMSHAQR